MATPGQRTAQRQAALRKRQGPGAWTYKGIAYDCTSKALDADKRGELLPDGVGNADSTDQRLITLNPADFPAAQLPGGDPLEGNDCSYQGHAYQIKKVLAYEEMAGVPIALPVVIFRKAPADSATDVPAPAGSAPGTPGARPVYAPPPSTI